MARCFEIVFGATPDEVRRGGRTLMDKMANYKIEIRGQRYEMVEYITKTGKKRRKKTVVSCTIEQPAPLRCTSQFNIHRPREADWPYIQDRITDATELAAVQWCAWLVFESNT